MISLLFTLHHEINIYTTLIFQHVYYAYYENTKYNNYKYK